MNEYNLQTSWIEAGKRSEFIEVELDTDINIKNNNIIITSKEQKQVVNNRSIDFARKYGHHRRKPLFFDRIFMPFFVGRK